MNDQYFRMSHIELRARIEELEADFDKGYEAGRDDMESEKDTVIEQLEEADKKRKALNAQMLMNAVASGNRNYLAEIEQLQAKVNQWEQWWFDMCDSTCAPPYHPDSYPQPPEDKT